MRVLVVDDSIVFRSAIRQAIEGQEGIEVAGTAIHGRQAIEKLQLYPKIEAIVLDLEMPVLGGKDTILELRKLGFKTPVIVFSAHSQAGAEKTIEALTAGAQDFLAKSSGEESPDGSIAELRAVLVPKILQFRGTQVRVERKTSSLSDLQRFRPQVIHIGSSTGGPEALKKMFSAWTVAPGVPILLTQHMPALFTNQLAQMLDRVCPALSIREARDGEEVLADRVYVAPGDYHLELTQKGGANFIHLTQSEKVNSVRPAVDVMIASSSKLYRRALNVILTGMGEDGLVACRQQKTAGNPVIIQDKESCVVFGMPGAVARESLEDFVGDITEIMKLLNQRWA